MPEPPRFFRVSLFFSFFFFSTRLVRNASQLVGVSTAMLPGGDPDDG